MTALPGWIRVALLDLRGDLKRFGVLIACLALGVGVIAAVSSVAAALQEAVARDARLVLGGDLEARLNYRAATPEEIATFESLGTVARVITTTARGASAETGGSAFLSIIATDGNYPLVGNVVTDPPVPAGQHISEATGQVDGQYGVMVDPVILDKLGVGIGDVMEISGHDFQIRGTLQSMPDQATRGFELGSPVLMSLDGLEFAEIVKPGVLSGHRYKIALNEGTSFDEAATLIRNSVADPSWELRSPTDATDELAEFFDLFTRFLTVVALSSLLVGGVGVSNAVAGYINERQRSIATMRSLGATSRRILVHFLVQILLLSLVGVAIGLLFGAISTAVLLPLLGRILSIPLAPSIHPLSLVTAGIFGLLIGFGFGFLPLVRAQKLRPALLFRSVGGALASLSWREMLRLEVILPLVIAAGAILGLAALTTNSPRLVLWYAVAALGAFILLRGAAWLLQHGLRLVPPLPNVNVRHALKSIHRPGAPAPTVILSLGLGLALVLLIALMDSNLRAEINGQLASEVPSFVIIDLFDDELAELQALKDSDPRIETLSSAPMLRGVITSVKGVPAADLGNLPPDVSWMFTEEVPFTIAAEPTGGGTITAGEWWPADYDGPQLVSMTEDLREELDIAVGDQIEVQVFGETVPATIANFRDFEWSSDGLNFGMTFSPGPLSDYPTSHMAIMKTAPENERDIESQLVRDYPQISFVRMGDLLGQISSLAGNLSAAVATVGGLAVVNGIFVLAGAMAAGRRQRESDAVLMKVLGATRGDVVREFLVEYGVLGILSALLAAFLGITGAWAISTLLLDLSFTPDIGVVLIVVIVAVVLTVLTGALTTWSALSTKPARHLRTTE